MSPYEQFQLNKYGNILCEDGFTKDVMPVNQQEDEDGISEDERAAAWFGTEAERQRYNDEINFPNSYK